MDSAASWTDESTREESSWTRSRPTESTVVQKKERTKRLKVVFEDEGQEFGADPTDEELVDRFTVATRLRMTRIEDVFREIRRARNVQLCFLVDCTGSMYPHIDGVRRSIEDIVNKLTDDVKDDAVAQSMTVAFVAYRDHGDTRQFEVLSFTNASEFKEFSSRLQAEGGGRDCGCEDVFGGLEKALALPWSQDFGTKVMFHICDYPAHGKEFHAGVSDFYPGGDPNGRTSHQLFSKLRELGIQYHFGKITEHTDIMIRKFSEVYGEPIVEFAVKDVDKIRISVITAVSISVEAMVSASQRTGGAGRKVREFTLDKTEPDWATLPEKTGKFMTYEFPKSIADIEDDVPLERRKAKSAIVKIATNPFGKGAERIAYYGKDVSTYVVKQPNKPSAKGAPKPPPKANEGREILKKDEKIVLKEYLHTGKGMNSVKRFELSNQMQTIASFLAQEFVKDLKKRAGIEETIKFIKIRTLALDKESPPRFMSCERRFAADAKFVRFTNNADYHIMEKKAQELGVDLEFVQLVTAFSHWTYKASKRFLMVVDLEGIVERIAGSGKMGVLLTDPAIHCSDVTRYLPMNHGPRGMKTFLDRHKCNHFCKELGLEGYNFM